MKIILSKKNIELYQNIPKEYLSLIINTILTRSAENGILIKELSFYLSQQEIEDVIDKLQIRDIKVIKMSTIKQKGVHQNDVKREVKKKIQEEKKSETLFEGFDD